MSDIPIHEQEEAEDIARIGDVEGDMVYYGNNEARHKDEFPFIVTYGMWGISQTKRFATTQEAAEFVGQYLDSKVGLDDAEKLVSARQELERYEFDVALPWSFKGWSIEVTIDIEH